VKIGLLIGARASPQEARAVGTSHAATAIIERGTTSRVAEFRIDDMILTRGKRLLLI
jgi:hypothetical protein